jgi:hypothetical protein
MTTRRKLGVALTSLVGVLALTGTALADTTITLTVGPVPLPDVPVEICVEQTDLPEPLDECVTTPPAESVSLTVIVHVDTPAPVLVPPTITPIPCPAGTQGVAARVFTGSAGASISGFVTIIVNGTPVTIPVDEVIAAGGQTVTIFACAGVSPGVPVPPLPAL